MRHATEHQFRSFDGQSLFYRHWAAAETTDDQRVIVLLHRGHEHSGRLQHIVDELNLPALPVFAWDARGHGRNEGPRGYSPSLAATVRDLDTFVRHLATGYGIDPSRLIVVGQSVGAVVAATWVHDYAPRIAGLVLAAPAFSIKLYVPLARPGLRLMHKLRGQFYVNSYVRPQWLTHDHERARSYAADPLITRPIAVNVLLDLYETAERIVDDAGAIQVPTQVLISGADLVVRKLPQREFFARLGSPMKELHELPGFFHDTLGEDRRELAFALMRNFIARLPARVERSELVHADQQGAAFAHYRQLQQQRPLWHPRRWQMSATRLGLRTVARLSRGVRLGWQTGFDSGSTLDYVYRNEADGFGPVGRMMDRSYLDSIGWQGIRQRKVHLQELIGSAIGELRANGRPVHIVDIAAGHGRYVLDAIMPHLDAVDSVLLRDYSDVNVQAGRELIRARGLQDKVQFVSGDAFDEASLAALQPAPTLAIVSGLYELFPANGPVQASLRGLARAMAPGGLLLYTNQPWHPQLELIARTLTSHRNGQEWVMRCRSQAEMDELAHQAGFAKSEQRIDRWGIFSVSLARRAPV